MGDDEAVLFADAVHPTHAARPVGCWAPKQEKLAIEQTSGRERINIHGAIDLATGQTRMIEVITVDAVSTIRLLESIEALYPLLALIHVFLDNARYHHAKLVQEWLARPGCRIKLHFIPSYCPHLNPIERLWGLMHRNVTHNKCYATCAQFADATLGFLRETSSPELGGPLRFGHRQFPRHQPKGISGHEVNRVYFPRNPRMRAYPHLTAVLQRGPTSNSKYATTTLMCSLAEPRHPACQLGFVTVRPSDFALH